jgi:hypothetical protein
MASLFGQKPRHQPTSFPYKSFEKDLVIDSIKLRVADTVVFGVLRVHMMMTANIPKACCRDSSAVVTSTDR